MSLDRHAPPSADPPLGDCASRHS